MAGAALSAGATTIGATTGTVTSVLAATAFSFLALAGAGAGAAAGDAAGATTASFLADLALFLVSAVLMFDTE